MPPFGAVARNSYFAEIPIGRVAESRHCIQTVKFWRQEPDLVGRLRRSGERQLRGDRHWPHIVDVEDKVFDVAHRHMLRAAKGVLSFTCNGGGDDATSSGGDDDDDDATTSDDDGGGDDARRRASHCLKCLLSCPAAGSGPSE